MRELETLSNVKFSKEAKDMAVKLAAYSIIKQLYKEGKITEEELIYIHDKYEIPVE